MLAFLPHEATDKLGRSPRPSKSQAKLEPEMGVSGALFSGASEFGKPATPHSEPQLFSPTPNTNLELPTAHCGLQPQATYGLRQRMGHLQE